MPTKINHSLTTAYDSNTRPHHDLNPVTYGNNKKIRKLLHDDFAFLPISYRNPGFLFRGLEVGLSDACTTGYFALNRGAHSLAHLERELNVILVSADFSDAFSVTRIWEAHEDAVIMALPADYFWVRYQQHQAATLGFAEPGVVFKYPFLCEAIALQDIACFIIGPHHAAKLTNALVRLTDKTSGDLCQRLIVVDDDCANLSRQALEQYLENRLQERQIVGAVPIQVKDFPTKSA